MADFLDALGQTTITADAADIPAEVLLGGDTGCASSKRNRRRCRGMQRRRRRDGDPSWHVLGGDQCLLGLLPPGAFAGKTVTPVVATSCAVPMCSTAIWNSTAAV